mgnify:CR=1 FL=1
MKNLKGTKVRFNEKIFEIYKNDSAAEPLVGSVAEVDDANPNWISFTFEDESIQPTGDLNKVVLHALDAEMGGFESLRDLVENCTDKV